jgi:hypothetical protein
MKAQAGNIEWHVKYALPTLSVSRQLPQPISREADQFPLATLFNGGRPCVESIHGTRWIVTVASRVSQSSIELDILKRYIGCQRLVSSGNPSRVLPRNMTQAKASLSCVTQPRNLLDGDAV